MNSSRLNFILTSILTTVTSATYAEPSHDIPQCFAEGTKVIDAFIDPKRADLGQCTTKTDCTFLAGGTGVHINKQKYYENNECFTQANTLVENLCRYGRISNIPHGGFGTYWSPSKKPVDYNCTNNRCEPIFSSKSTEKNRWTMPNKDLAKANPQKPCIQEFEKTLSLKMQKYFHK